MTTPAPVEAPDPPGATEYLEAKESRAVATRSLPGIDLSKVIDRKHPRQSQPSSMLVKSCSIMERCGPHTRSSTEGWAGYDRRGEAISLRVRNPTCSTQTGRATTRVVGKNN